MLTKAYHYIQKGHHVMDDGLCSFAVSPKVNVDFYKRSGAITRAGVIDWMEKQFSGYSRGIRCFSEPVQGTTPHLKQFLSDCDRIEINVQQLMRDGALESIYIHPPLPPDERVLAHWSPVQCQDGFVRLPDITNIPLSPVNWNICNDEKGWRFAFVPFYLLVVKSGRIPPAYLRLYSN